MLHFLFSFRGRINRAKFLAFYVGAGVLYIAIAPLLVLLTEKQEAAGFASVSLPQTEQRWFFYLLCWAFHLIYVYCYGAVITKRLHDLELGAKWLGYFALLFVLGCGAMEVINHGPAEPSSPAQLMVFLGARAVAVLTIAPASLLGLAGMVKMLLLSGTPGDNRFGPDPLGNPVVNPFQGEKAS